MTTAAIWYYYIGVCIALLQVFLFLIARFYQRTAGEQTRSGVFIISMILFLMGYFLYGFQGPPLVGNVLADMMLFLGGSVLIANGFLLLKTMMQG